MSPSEPAPSPWQGMDVDAMTYAEISDVLGAMELGRSQNVDSHVEPAEAITALASAKGWEDLGQRARLVRADIHARQGRLATGSTTMLEVLAWAERHAEPYIAARANFLLAIIAQAIGDLPQTRLYGIRSVELLPQEAPPGILIDHLIMLGGGYEPGATEATRWYTRALDLATTIGDYAKAAAVYNNLAFNAYETRSAELATEYVRRLLEITRIHHLPMKGVAVDTIARVQIMNGEYEDALRTLAPATAAEPPPNILMTEPYALPECLLAESNALRLLGRIEEAQRRTHQAREVSHERQLDGTSARVREEQARLYAASGKFELAYLEHVAFHDDLSALESKEREDRARLVQTAFQAEQDQQERTGFREMAMRDALTGLYNRRFIENQLSHLMEPDSPPRTIAAAIMDVDYFKRINDTASHEVGDTVLVQLAKIFDSQIIAPETVGRLGGDEFVIVLPGLDAAAAADRCERIRKAVEDFSWQSVSGSIRVSVTIGVTAAASNMTSPGALLSSADRNLYAAKRSGRNRVMGDSAF